MLNGVGVEDCTKLNLIGKSAPFRRTVGLVSRVAACQETVLISGETGTGKELFARAVHYLGQRRGGPFVPVNCGGIPDTLLEGELFGHERGAFTDARERRSGLVAEARGGTLFLDEIEAMSARAQVVLLRFLQDQQFRPLGSNAIVTGDVRIVAATNANLGLLASHDKFRRDLFFRLGVLVIDLPPLRERTGDPELLARTFLARYSQRYGRPPKRLGPAACAWLARHDWPGNVRELESLMLREFLMGDGDEIELPARAAAPAEAEVEVEVEAPQQRPPQPASIGGRSFRRAKADAVASFERRYLGELLQLTEGNLSLAARRAGKDRTTLKRLMRRHGVDRGSFGPAR